MKYHIKHSYRNTLRRFDIIDKRMTPRAIWEVVNSDVDNRVSAGGGQAIVLTMHNNGVWR